MARSRSVISPLPRDPSGGSGALHNLRRAPNSAILQELHRRPDCLPRKILEPRLGPRIDAARQTGSVTDSALIAAWVEASATVVAVGAAIYAGYYAKRAFIIEVSRDFERDEDRRSAQAEAVAGWSGPIRTTYPRYYIRNASNAPVYSVEVLFRVGEADGGGDFVRVVPPGEATDRPIPPDVVQMCLDYAPDRSDTLSVAITFRDSAGRTFSRGHDGVLQRTG